MIQKQDTCKICNWSWIHSSYQDLQLIQLLLNLHVKFIILFMLILVSKFLLTYVDLLFVFFQWTEPDECWSSTSSTSSSSSSSLSSPAQVSSLSCGSWDALRIWSSGKLPWNFCLFVFCFVCLFNIICLIFLRRGSDHSYLFHLFYCKSNLNILFPHKFW